MREYERTITAVIHGYVQPRVAALFGSLQKALAEAGVPAVPQVTKSNGGVMSAELGKDHCAQMIMSGTAAGVIGASYVARLSGFRDTMSLDIGGTSADVAIIRDGQPQYRRRRDDRRVSDLSADRRGDLDRRRRRLDRHA